ncbi:hypothetical protein DFJ73DRAFT_827240 [Zopfochytrium polystomum]|nr:hypothetical protein DFJ73DRAFT_827235 [Zopfochytrium polystomum]KAI9354631.1 hypothetical protein DFJ73DRAFT_827240 [Zopfochytrium polystomum]
MWAGPGLWSRWTRGLGWSGGASLCSAAAAVWRRRCRWCWRRCLWSVLMAVAVLLVVVVVCRLRLRLHLRLPHPSMQVRGARCCG